MRNFSTLHQLDMVATLRMGKQPVRHDPRTLKLSTYTKGMAAPPAQAGYVDKVPEWPMFLNDVLGDCTVACAGHMIQQWTTYADATPVVLSDNSVLFAYQAVSGYSPNKPGSDRGAVVLDVLNYWRKRGIGGHKIAAFVSVNPHNIDEIKTAVSLFGNCYIGVGLPLTAQDPLPGVNGNPVWSVRHEADGASRAPFSWGGHAIPVVGYGHDVEGNDGSEVVSWGQVFDMTWGFFAAYCDEAYAVVSQDWIERDGRAPSGFDLANLLGDLAQFS